jgi:hypothetical protein
MLEGRAIPKPSQFRGLLDFALGTGAIEAPGDVFSALRDYAIFAPDTQTLRGVQVETAPRAPFGLHGGRLPEAIAEILDWEEGKLGAMPLDDALEMLDWVDSFHVASPTREILSADVAATKDVVRFRDRFMRENRNELTAYDASEGALYVLFLLALATHPDSPRCFAIDNFDQALHPRLARSLTERFCEQVIAAERVVFLTSHNPLVLDGLDLSNPKIRLFAVERDMSGATRLEQVKVDAELIELGREGNYTLSQLWVMGRLGGVPHL